MIDFRQTNALPRRLREKPVWLARIGPALQVEEIWNVFLRRAPLEAKFQFRKRYLSWTLPKVHTHCAAAQWTRLVTLAQWTLYLSRDLVRDQPQPWQKRQVRLTPERVKQSLGGLSSLIGTPAQAPKRRGKSPG